MLFNSVASAGAKSDIIHRLDTGGLGRLGTKASSPLVISEADSVVSRFLRENSEVYKTLLASDMSGPIDDIEIGPEVHDLQQAMERVHAEPTPTLPVLFRLKTSHTLYASLTGLSVASMEQILRTADFWDVSHPACERIRQEIDSRSHHEGVYLRPILAKAARVLATIMRRDGYATDDDRTAVIDQAVEALYGRRVRNARLQTLIDFGAQLLRGSAIQLPTDLSSKADALELAAIVLDFDCCDRLVYSGTPLTARLPQTAAIVGCLQAIQWAREQGCPWDVETCIGAAESGSLDVLQWARAKGCRWNDWTCSTAALNGHLHILQWARENGCHWDDATCTSAARGGHVHILKWARENGCPWTAETCSEAARKGHLDVLKYARCNGCPWGVFTCSGAALNGELETLQWARANGCPWDEFTCSNAVEGGHLAILQWAREHHCPWDETTCTVAAMSGHLEALQWARNNGCPWYKPKVMQFASKYPRMLSWVISQPG